MPSRSECPAPFPWFRFLEARTSTICLDHTRTENHQSRASKASKARTSCRDSCSFSLISLSRSAINLLDCRMRALVRMLGGAPLVPFLSASNKSAYLPPWRGVPTPPLAACQCARRKRKYAAGAQAEEEEEEEEALPVHWADHKKTHYYHHMEPKKCSWDRSSRASIIMG